MKQQLNICSGHDYRKDYINLDMSDKDMYGNNIKVDVKHDITKFPYPFSDESFEFVYMHNSLEHFDKEMIPRIIKELLRITKRDGEVLIIVPHFPSYVNPRDLTHKTLFSYETIESSVKNEYIKSIETRLIFSNNKVLRFMNVFFRNRKVIKFYERFLCYILLSEELHVHIKRK